MQHFENFELKNYTSFKIGGEAKNVYFPETIEEFVSLLQSKNAYLVLGGMSNVLISSRGIDKDVILTKKLNKYTITENKVKAQAGVIGPLLSKAVANENLSGMEFMCGFPGSIGGIVTMNASAHNQAISDIIKSATIFDKETNSIKTLSKNELQMEYRKTIIQSKPYIVLEAEFELSNKNKDAILAQMQSNNEFRRERQPNLSKPNCGSVFKNPQGDSAGRLLELAGAKELFHNDAKVFEKHANFIINTGVAKSEDVSHLMEKMYNKVKDNFGIELQPEVEFIGIKNEEEKKIWAIWNKEPLKN